MMIFGNDTKDRDNKCKEKKNVFKHKLSVKRMKFTYIITTLEMFRNYISSLLSNNANHLIHNNL